MPNRVIKDSVWDSPSLAKLEQYYQDQWLRWLLMADDWGCFNADPEVIKGKVYPKRKETVKIVIKIRNIFYNAGKLFVWTDKNERTWGFFVNWDKHQFCGACGIDEEGKYTKHRRKTPPPPEKELSDYFDKFRHLSTEFVIPNPIPNPNHNPNTLIVKLEFFNYYNQKLKEKGWIKQKLQLTYPRKRLIESRLKEGRTLDDLKQCVNNFVQDKWEDRHKYIDLKYCLGIVRGIDMCEKWLNFATPKKKGKSWID